MHKRKITPLAKLKVKADSAWSYYQKISAGGKCEVCDSRLNLEAHHYFHRTCLSTRYDKNNGIVLCGLCHAHEHKTGQLIKAFKLERPDEYAELERKSNILVKYTEDDYKRIIAELSTYGER